MPVLTPTGLAFQFSDLANEVILRAENRTTDLTRASIWLRDALIEITTSPDLRDEFDELEENGPLFNLTGAASLAAGSIQEYAFSNFIPAGDYNLSTLNIVLWTDYPNNTTQIKLEPTSYQEADAITRYVGQPVKWYRFADTCGFVPPPDKNYQCQARLYRAHPINDNALSQTVILLDRSWNEILIWAAVERGFMEVLEYEKATAIHTMLFGDPRYPHKPGLIAGRKRRRSKEMWRQQVSLRPVIRRYSSS